MPNFRREGHPVVSPHAFLEFVGVPMLTREKLHDVAMAKKSTAGGLDGWAWNEVKALSSSWFVELAQVLKLRMRRNGPKVSLTRISQ